MSRRIFLYFTLIRGYNRLKLYHGSAATEVPMKQQGKGKLYYSMLAISVLPILLYGISIIVFSTYSFSSTINKEVASGLEDAANLCISLFDTAYPGDYQLVETQVGDQTAYSLYKGAYNITKDNTTLDKIKSATDMDVTLFYQDTRILTTITNWNNQRIIGTGAPEIVIADVLEKNQACFYDNVIINGTSYFAYYTPLINSDGTVVGMLFIGKPTDNVQQMIHHSIFPIVAVGFLALIIASIVSFLYAKNFLSALQKLKNFFKNVSTGNLNAQLDAEILKREDELSQIGRSALHMQRSLRNLIELDSLTELNNRRSGDKKLQETYSSAQAQNTPFTIVIADIDYFKSINDTYGHQNGDIVLHSIAQILKQHMQGKGYAIRWGGEEFLLVYENSSLEQTVTHLEQLQAEIRNITHLLDNDELHVTMTFGAACAPEKNIHLLIQAADTKLYEGKSNGRDCIVS